MSQLVLNIEGTPKGTDVEIQGLGVFPNGETSTLTSEQCDAYQLYRKAHFKRPVKWPLHIPATKTKPTKDEEDDSQPVVIVEDKVPVDGNKKGDK